MDTADKNKLKAALALLPKGYRISKSKKKSIARELMYSAFADTAAAMIKTPNLTIRRIFLKAIKSSFFNTCLDTLHQGTKRAEFDSKAPKTWTLKTVTQDIQTRGQFKRFKLIERHVNVDINFVKAVFDPDYRPAGKVVVRKRAYKKKK
tara:strand:+ start:46 stop:492 length:447 start_codon:yes stop_codon:yes gene_type:complete